MKNNKKQLLIFSAIAFTLPFTLGILMGFGYVWKLDISVFPLAQMFYPAAGVILAALITRRSDPLIPRRFFMGFLIITVLLLICTVASVLIPEKPWSTASEYLIIFGSPASLLLLLSENKKKRSAYGLTGGHWKTAVLIILLYLVLYTGRWLIGWYVNGEIQGMIEIIRGQFTLITLASVPLNYLLSFIAFLGEEYGWRYYLQPMLQKKLGMVQGILVLGVIWGLWHLPINLFYYNSPSVGIISLTVQLIVCIALDVFYGWAYLKTDNIWTVVILHFLNNNLIPVFTGNYSSEALQNQQISWGDAGFCLPVYTLLFMGVIFSKHFKNFSHRLPTMDERADQVAKTCNVDTEPCVSVDY